MPYYIWLAHKTGRKLLIKHTKPYPFEKFLVPPEGGLDWRLPDEFLDEEWEVYQNRSFLEYKRDRRIFLHEQIHKPEHNDTRFIFSNANLVKTWGVFESNTNMRIEDVWPSIFRRMFQPAKELGEIIDSIAKENGLIPGEYGGAHIRARYPLPKGSDGNIQMKKESQHPGVNMEDNVTRAFVQKMGDNAARCVVKAMPETKHIYFASDTSEVLDYLLNDSPAWARNRDNRGNTTDAVATNHTKLPHIVVRPDYKVHSQHLEVRNIVGSEVAAAPKDFYQIFVDLWILSHTKCISQGVGGFAHFASMLSGNHLKCRTRHRDNQLGFLETCPSPSELKIMKNHMKRRN